MIIGKNDSGYSDDHNEPMKKYYYHENEKINIQNNNYGKVYDD